MSTTITTLSGAQLDIFDLDVEAICLDDMVTGLSNICRFGGQSKSFFSDAQHCVNVSFLGKTLKEKQDGLLHDAAEFIVGDMITPIKYSGELNTYKLVEKNINKLLLMKYTGRSVYSEKIKFYDELALLVESKRFHPRLYSILYQQKMLTYDSEHGTMSVVEYAELMADRLMLEPLNPQAAKNLFLNRFAELFNA